MQQKLGKVMRPIRVKITMHNGEVWYATAPNLKQQDPTKVVATLNRISQLRQLGSTYELATEEAYWAYRDGNNLAKRGQITFNLSGIQ